MQTDLDLIEQLRLMYQLQQQRTGAEGAKEMFEVNRAFFEGRITEREYEAASLLVESTFHGRGSRIALEFVNTNRYISAPRVRHADPVRAKFDQRASLARCRATVKFRRTFETRDDMGGLPGRSRSANLYAQKVAVEVSRTVLNAGRNTILESATANRVRWRRVTSAKPCAFCVYQAALTANYADLNQGLVHYFHGFCGCSVTEVFGDGQFSPLEHSQFDAFERARQACKDEGLSLTPKNITGKMRELADTDQMHDAVPPKTQAGGAGGGGGGSGGAGGGGGGGNQPSRGLAGDGEREPRKPKRGGREPRERTPEDYAYWQKRQDALPFETRGAVMKPHEIEFAEAFLASGFSIERWLRQGIPDDSGRITPSSDFLWAPGRVVELKRTGKSGTMKRYIKDNLEKGKRLFMADFGDTRPSAKELRSLRKFSPQGEPKFELWAFWDGHLERLH